MTDRDKDKFLIKGKKGTSISDRFFEKIEMIPECGCWIWNASWDSVGYGLLGHTKAHRLSWEMHKSKIPIGMMVLHRCDTPSCVNPHHLYIGTQIDNRRDCINRKRTNLPIGMNHHKSKLSDNDILEIRNSNKSQRDLAKKYKITQANIHAIKSKKTWRHLP